MIPIKTKETNIEYGAGQKEYQPLPAFKSQDGQVVTCWQMTDDELQRIIESKCVYLRQLTFNQALQPVSLHAENPVIPFTPHKQTRVDTGEQIGNCYATVLACIMQESSPEDVLQIQAHFKNKEWRSILEDYLEGKGWELTRLDGHLDNDSVYFVWGESPRNENNNHVVIYKNGEMVHDPHPDNTGIKSTLLFEQLTKIAK